MKGICPSQHCTTTRKRTSCLPDYAVWSWQTAAAVFRKLCREGDCSICRWTTALQSWHTLNFLPLPQTLTAILGLLDISSHLLLPLISDTFLSHVLPKGSILIQKCNFWEGCLAWRLRMLGMTAAHPASLPTFCQHPRKQQARAQVSESLTPHGRLKLSS